MNSLLSLALTDTQFRNDSRRPELSCVATLRHHLHEVQNKASIATSNNLGDRRARVPNPCCLDVTRARCEYISVIR